MPFAGMSQVDYAQKLIDEYKAADVLANWSPNIEARARESCMDCRAILGSH